MDAMAGLGASTMNFYPTPPFHLSTPDLLSLISELYSLPFFSYDEDWLEQSDDWVAQAYRRLNSLQVELQSRKQGCQTLAEYERSLSMDKFNQTLAKMQGVRNNYLRKSLEGFYEKFKFTGAAAVESGPFRLPFSIPGINSPSPLDGTTKGSPDEK